MTLLFLRHFARILGVSKYADVFITDLLPSSS